MAIRLADLSRSRHWDRPTWPYRLNGASPQARDLALWAPGGAWFVWGPNTPITGVAAPRIAGTTHGPAYRSSGVASSYWTFPAITVSAQFTIAMYAYREVDDSGQAFQSCNGSSSNYGGCQCALGNASAWSANYGANTAGDSTGRRTATAITDIGLNRVAHLVAVCRGATDWSLYTNGQSETPSYSGSGGSLVNTATAGSIGRAIVSPGSATAGFVDVRVYNRALTPAEVWALYDPQTRWDLYWKPSTRVMFDFTAATFNPAWARNANHLITGVV